MKTTGLNCNPSKSSQSLTILSLLNLFLALIPRSHFYNLLQAHKQIISIYSPRVSYHNAEVVASTDILHQSGIPQLVQFQVAHKSSEAFSPFTICPIHRIFYYESLCSHHLDESDLIPELLSAFFFECFFFWVKKRVIQSNLSNLRLKE